MNQPQQTTKLSDTEIDKLQEIQSTLATSVDHALRRPMTIIQGYAELLSDGTMGTLEPEQETAVFAITSQARDLRALIERASTILAVKDTIPREWLNLKDVVTLVIESLQAKAKQDDITLFFHTASNIPQILGQSYHLQQAVTCLIENAIKFTPSGGRVEVDLEVEADWVVLTLTDTGLGLTEEELKQLFESFYHVDGALSRKYGGPGLGLAMVKAIINAYRGQIYAESWPGEGNCFTMKLPVSQSKNQPTQNPIESLQPQRILIVDDERYVAITLKAGLEKLPNCKVSLAYNGKQALQYFEIHPFDLLITDYKMPGMDGLSLAAQVQQRYPHTSIIMITAYNSDDLNAQASDVSIRHILNKPVEFSEIRRAASEALSNSSKS